MKSSNVMLDDGVAKIIDLGVSRVVRDTNDTLTKGQGTPLYMAPEGFNKV